MKIKIANPCPRFLTVWALILIPVYIVLALYASRLYTGGDFLRWTVPDREGDTEISTWVNGDTCYVFLPSYARIEDLSFQINPLFRVSVNGVSLNAAANLGNFSTDVSYPLKIQSIIPVSVRFLQFFISENIPALYLQTEPGGLEQIQKSKEKKTTVTGTLFDTDGTGVYTGTRDTLKCRGQGSWTLPKKSYSLNLENDASLLGMPEGSMWALIANYLDPTNLRNKLAYELVGKSGFVLSPSCEYVSLYTNGAYQGLYLLVQKPEDVVNRVFDTRTLSSGGEAGFLCKNDLPYRFNTLRHPFMTDNGRAVKITLPETVLEKEKERIVRQVQDMEDAILNSAESDLWPVCLDLDSWCGKYLLEELLGNIDADFASSYFYCLNTDESPIFSADWRGTTI